MQIQHQAEERVGIQPAHGRGPSERHARGYSASKEPADGSMRGGDERGNRVPTVRRGEAGWLPDLHRDESVDLEGMHRIDGDVPPSVNVAASSRVLAL